MEHGLKDIKPYVQEGISHWTSCYNLRLIHDKLLWAPAYVRLVSYQVLTLYWTSWIGVTTQRLPPPGPAGYWDSSLICELQPQRADEFPTLGTEALKCTYLMSLATLLRVKAVKPLNSLILDGYVMNLEYSRGRRFHSCCCHVNYFVYMCQVIMIFKGLTPKYKFDSKIFPQQQKFKDNIHWVLNRIQVYISLISSVLGYAAKLRAHMPRMMLPAWRKCKDGWQDSSAMTTPHTVT